LQQDTANVVNKTLKQRIVTIDKRVRKKFI
jgi:hypothetical protein